MTCFNSSLDITSPHTNAVSTPSTHDYQLVRLVLEDAEPYIDFEGALPTRLCDVIGATVVANQASSPNQGVNNLIVFAYPRKTEGNCLYASKRPSLERRARHLRLSAPTSSVAKQWDAWIKAWCRGGPQQQSGGEEAQQLIKPTGQERRRLLVLVNPESGRRQSHHIYTSVVAPMLQQADVEHELIVTTRTQHAKEILHDLDVEAWGGAVAIGGDGLLSEVIQGLFKQDPENRRALSRLPLAIVNGGTGNGLFSSLLHHHTEAFTPICATFLLLKAKSIMPADLSLVETADGQRHLSFLSLSFGLIADVDLESEVIRWAGSLRMDFFSLYAIFRNRTYRARFSFLPCEEGGTSLGEAVQLPPLDMPLSDKDGWVSIEDDFLMVRALGEKGGVYREYVYPGVEWWQRRKRHEN